MSMRGYSPKTSVKVDRDGLRDQLRCAMTCAGELAISSPDLVRIRTCLRSEFLGRDAAAVFPAGLSTTIGDLERGALLRFTQTRRAMLELRENEIDFSWRDAEEELIADRSLLLFAPQSSLFDGAATPVTHGFLNTNYFPPWDTWLDLLEGMADEPEPILVSWVPRWCRQFVDDGIAVDPASCLAWGMPVDDAIACRGWGKTWAEGQVPV
jgi:hypothetical protein